MSATTPAPAAPESTWSDRDTAAAIPGEVRDAVDAVLVDSDLARPEREAWEVLAGGGLRLEQERIAWDWACARLDAALRA